MGFKKKLKNNFDNNVINDFGDEWEKFNQSDSNFTSDESDEIFDNYFNIFPLNKLNKNSIVMDLGCGSGRWAKHIAPRVKKLVAVDPSIKALNTAKINLKKFTNVEFLLGDISTVNIKDNSFDFIYSLGVLHHIPDTTQAIKDIYDKLKPDSPFLVYLYYSLDNRPMWFKLIWRSTNLLRIIISNLPFLLKKIICDLLAFIIYLPLAYLSLILTKFKINTNSIPLSFYKDKSFYTMRTDSLDRFGTKLEKRFSLEQIKNILKDSGYIKIINSNKPPYWCVLSYKKKKL